MARTTASSPERSALAEALAKAHAARKVRDAAQAAQEPAREAVWRARERLEAAEAAVEAAKSEAARRAAVSLAEGNVIEAPAALREARVALTEAQDDLEIALGTKDALFAREGSDEAAVTLTARTVQDAVRAVIRSEAGTEALAAEVIALQQVLADKAASLMYLVDKCDALPRADEPGGRFGQVRDRQLYDALNRMRVMGVWNDLLSASQSAAALKASSAALETDPAAPLPGSSR